MGLTSYEVFSSAVVVVAVDNLSDCVRQSEQISEPTYVQRSEIKTVLKKIRNVLLICQTNPLQSFY